MIYKSIAVASVLILGATAANAQVGANGLSDTSKICSGQGLTLHGPQPPASTVYAYEWKDGVTVVSTDSLLVLPTATPSTTITAPAIKNYTLTVTQTGGAACPSEVYTKVVISYPPLTDTVIAASAFYCLTGGVDVVLNATALANGSAPGLTSGYGGLVYTWSGTPNAGATTSNSGATYTIPASNFTSANTYTYTNSVTYIETLVGTTAGKAACTASSFANVIINVAPTVNNTTVTTTYQ